MASDQHLLLDKIPRERWVYALGALLLHGFTNHPDALLNVIMEGEKRFVDACILTDKYGMSRTEYSKIYKRLARAATRMGLSTRVQ